jgi:hypothetical protein
VFWTNEEHGLSRARDKPEISPTRGILKRGYLTSLSHRYPNRNSKEVWDGFSGKDQVVVQASRLKKKPLWAALPISGNS